MILHLNSRMADGLISPSGRLLYRLGAVLVGIMPFPIFIDVGLRFFTGKTIPGIIEIEEFMLVMIVYCAVGHIQRKKAHVEIDFLIKRFSAKLRAIVESLVLLLATTLFFLMSWRFLLKAVFSSGEVSFQLAIPIWIFVGIAALGTLVLALTLLSDFFQSAARLRLAGQGRYIFLILVASVLIFLSPKLVNYLPLNFSGLSLGALGMGFLFVLIFLGMPIAFAMLLSGFLGLWILNNNAQAALTMLGAIPFSDVATWIMVVAPLFILMGELAYFSGISKELFNAAYKWFGRMPGGLGISSIVGCACFSAVSGDSLSTAVTMGSIALPEMEKKKYRNSLATGSIAAGGTLGILIPPSIGFIFYALVTETSIAKLFIAGILPGFLLTIFFIMYIYGIAKLKPEMAPAGEKTTLKDKLVSLKGIVTTLTLVVLILGGILGGVFSPTEGGAIGAVGILFFAILRRKIKWSTFWQATTETTDITAKLLFIVAGVGLLGTFLASTRLPFLLAEMVTGLGLNRYVILTAIICLYLLLGCILNVIAVILITMPAIYPTVLAMGFDPIWFGVISVILMEMGQITPPIGIIVFAISSVAKNVPMEQIFQGIVPFVVCMIVCIVLLTIFPQIALFLPNLFFS